MSKPTLVTLPCVLLLLDYWPLGRWQKALTSQSVPVLIDEKEVKKKSKKLKSESSGEKKIVKPVHNGRKLIGNLLWEKVPFFFLALVLSVLLILQLQEDRYLLSLQQIPFSDRMMNAMVSYVAYLGKTFWPVDLAVFYPYVNSFPIWQVLGALMLLVGTSTAVIYLAKRAPFLAVGWFWYLGVLFPVIGLMQAGGQARADRYTYFPSIGIAIILTWGITYLLPKENLRKIIIIPAAIILTALTFLTWQQCGYWKNSINLFNHVLEVTKDNVIAHTGLGSALSAQGKQAEAIAHYNEAIRINPDYDIAHYALGSALDAQGKQAEAIAHYLAAIKINPHHSSAHFNLGVLLGKQFKDYEALYYFREALRIEPNEPGIYLMLGVALARTGKLNEAIDNFRTAIYLKPDYAEAHSALKITLDIAQKQKR